MLHKNDSQPPSTPTGRAMRADAQSNRQALLATARRLFSDLGTGVPLRTVAAEAGVGIGTLYRHFPTRDDLIVGLVQDTRDRIVAMAERHSATWNSEPAKTWTAFATELSQLALGALSGAGANAGIGERASARIDAMRVQGFAAVDTLLLRAKASGLVADEIEPDRFLAGLAAVGRPLAPEIGQRLPGQAQWLVGVYLRGLRDSLASD